MCRDVVTGSFAARTPGGSFGLTRRTLILRTKCIPNYLLLPVTKSDLSKAYPQQVCSVASKVVLIVFVYNVFT